MCVVALSLPAIAHPQVIAQLNEQAAGSTFEEISSGSFTQFVGDRFVAFAGRESIGPYDGLWLKDVAAPRGVIQQFGLQPPNSWVISADKRYVIFDSNEKLVPDKNNVCFRFGDLRQTPCIDLFIRDLTTGSVTRILGPEGREIAANFTGGKFSADGRWIVFQRPLASDPRTQPLQSCCTIGHVASRRW